LPDAVAAVDAEAIALVVAGTAAVAAALSTGLAAWQGFMMKASERNRTQPVVVVYERALPKPQGGDQVLLTFWVTNEGVGSAFNIRFGIAIGNRSASYVPQPSGVHGVGDVPRALAPGGRLPDGGRDYELAVPASFLGDESERPRRVYWCRYENAFGHTWESRNPWQPEEELTIRRL
jgi:hypothetical protein